MKKIFRVICLFFVSCFLFSGCANVYYSFIMSSDGSIKMGLEIDLDKTTIEQAGYNYDEAKNEIYEKLESIIQNQQAKIFQYASYVNKLPSKCGVSVDYDWYNSNVLYAYLQFDSRDTYKSYNDFLSGTIIEDDEQDPTTTQEEHFLYIKIIQKAENPFKDIASRSFVQDLLEYFNGDDNKNTFTLDDVNYTYYYGMPTKKLYSNSNYYFMQSDIKIHTWRFDSESINDDIEFYNIAIKPVAWYLLAIIITFISLFVIMIILYFKNIKQKIDLQNSTKNTSDVNEIDVNENIDIIK